MIKKIIITGIKIVLLPLVFWCNWRILWDWLRNVYPYYEWLKRDLADCESILELGCGSSSPLLKIGYGYKTDAVDIWQPYVDMHNEKGDYHYCTQADILAMDFQGESYDAVVICDVLEHLSKPGVYQFSLFDKIERVAKKKVILFTPNGFVPNDEVDGDPFQAHISAWFPRDYQERGYKVVGSTGVRALMGKASLPRFKPAALFQILIMLTQPMVYWWPRVAWHSYAVKETQHFVAGSTFELKAVNEVEEPLEPLKFERTSLEIYKEKIRLLDYIGGANCQCGRLKHRGVPLCKRCWERVKMSSVYLEYVQACDTHVLKGEKILEYASENLTHN